MKKKTLLIWVAALLGLLPSVAQEPQAYDAAPRALKPVVRSERTPRMLAPRAQQAKARRAVSPALFQGLKLYANLTNSDDWAGASIGSVPYGIYSYTIGEDMDFQPISTDLLFNYMASAMGRDELVGVRPMEIFGSLNGIEYDGLDSVQFKLKWQEIIDGGEADYSFIPSVMTYDVTSNTIFSAQYNADLTGLNWAKWNPTTHRFEVLHKWNNDFQPLTLGTTPDGQMYCVGADGFFYQIDKQTGDASMLGQLGIEPTLYVQSMTYEPTTACFLWMAVSQSGSGLYALNPENGETTLIRRLSKNEQAASVFFNDNQAPAKAPAAITDLQFNYSGNGSTTGNITFTVPSKTFGGSSFSGNVQMSVWLDGKALADAVSVATGSKQTFAFDVTNDNHYVDVVLKNDAGFSPHNFVYAYAGYDVPLPATDVTLSVADGVSTLSWKAPQGGVNGGYIDFDALTYNIYRMPGNVLAAEQVKGTQFSETLPTKMERYYYIVVPFNGGQKQGEGTESNRVLTGSSFQPPYSDDFSDETTQSLWTVVNVAGDKSDYGQEYTWQFQNWGPDWNLSTGSYAIGEGLDGVDDYLISPGVELKKDLTYALTVNMRNTFSGYKERVSLLVGTNPADVSTFRAIATNEEYDVMADGQGNGGRPWEADFQVEQDGTYYMAVRGFTKRDDNASGLFVYGLSVDELGVNGAPAEVTDLVITPEAEGEMQADISFTVPDKTLGGDELKGSLTANIYRDDAPDALKQLSVEPGKKAQWTDETVEGVAEHTYTVSVSNAEGEGKKVSAKAFIGVYAAPYANTFDQESDAQFFVTTNDSVSGGNTCKWAWNQYNQNLSLGYFVQKDYEPIWLYFPAVKLEQDEVYSIDFDWAYSSYNATSPATFTIGMAQDSIQQTKLGDLPFTNDLGYGVAYPAQNEVVATKTGKYYPAVFMRGNRGEYGDYVSPTIDNVSITHVGSAFAPYSVENLTAENDKTGALRAMLSFEAPTRDFAQRDLSGTLTILIYRSGSAIPVKTFTGVKPGEQMEWTDEQPLNGKNAYTVVAQNEKGRGKAATAETFAGIDVPEGVEEMAIRGTADNQQAVITWKAPSAVGQNGGVVDASLTYNIVEYFPNETEQEKQVKVIAQTQETTYTVERDATDEMEQHVYAVITQTSAGMGKAVLDYVVLGKLKETPFAESFANGGLSATGWVVNGDVAQYGAQWQLVQDSEEQAAQDADNGFALCYNGNYYAQYHYSDLITPKMKAGEYADYTLSFYVYHGAESTQAVLPTLVVSQSTDDGAFEQLGDTIRVTEGEKGWKKYEISLPQASKAHFVKFCFRGLLSTMSERIWIDNIQMEGKVAVAIDGVEPQRSQSKSSTVFDLQGRPATKAQGRGRVLVVDGQKRLMK